MKLVSELRAAWENFEPEGRLFLVFAYTITGIVLALHLSGCDCPEAPDEYRGASLTGCSDGGSVTCCSYSGDRCAYTLCQEACGEWSQESWYCW